MCLLGHFWRLLSQFPPPWLSCKENISLSSWWRPPYSVACSGLDSLQFLTSAGTEKQSWLPPGGWWLPWVSRGPLGLFACLSGNLMETLACLWKQETTWAVGLSLRNVLTCLMEAMWLHVFYSSCSGHILTEFMQPNPDNDFCLQRPPALVRQCHKCP